MHLVSGRSLTLQDDARGACGEDTLWHLMADAPRDGRNVRVRVWTREFGETVRELPWLVFWNGKNWCYGTTGIPLQSWHVPVEWSAEPRTPAQREHFYDALCKARAAVTTFGRTAV